MLSLRPSFPAGDARTGVGTARGLSGGAAGGPPRRHAGGGRGAGGGAQVRGRGGGATGSGGEGSGGVRGLKYQPKLHQTKPNQQSTGGAVGWVPVWRQAWDAGGVAARVGRRAWKAGRRAAASTARRDLECAGQAGRKAQVRVPCGKSQDLCASRSKGRVACVPVPALQGPHGRAARVRGGKWLVAPPGVWALDHMSTRLAAQLLGLCMG